jgi:hypothetical protein
MSEPFLVSEPNLSVAWSKVLLRILDRPGKSISPLVVSVTGFNDGEVEEDSAVRTALDEFLVGQGDQTTQTVANTIFPASIWRLAKHDRQRLYQLYIEDGFPSYKEICSSKNSRGLYFERLIAFGSGPHGGNQLEHIITEFNGRHGVRTSMFQASVFDPARDHVRSAQLGFPCMQHISFVPDDEGLTLNAFYATQQLINKAYGNYLGLCRLGEFMASQMKIKLDRVNCFVGVEKLEGIGKTSASLEPVRAAARDSVARANASPLVNA